MAAKITYHARLEIVDELGNTKTLRNNLGNGIAISDLDEIAKFPHKLPASSAPVAVDVWSKAVNVAQPDFRALWIETDAPVDVEFTTDDGAGDQLSVVPVEADVPYVLFADESRHTAVAGDLLAGTAGKIDRIRVINRSDVVAANFALYLCR